MPQPLPFSKIRTSDKTFYLSGELGFDSEGVIVGDIRQQTRQTLHNIERTLQSAGLELRHVISCTCFLNNKADFLGFNETYREFFLEQLPVRTTVVCDLVLEARVEITVIAAAP